MTTTTETIQVRQDTSTNWSTNNPVPKAGEWCFETDTGIVKMGDGSTAYNSLVPYRQTTATKTELDKLHGLSTTSTELGYVHGVTSAIQTQINSKFAKADIQTSFGSTLSDEKVASEKLVKNNLDAKQDNITVANSSMLKASVLSAMNIVGENNSGRRYDEPKTLAKMISAAHSNFDASKFTQHSDSTPVIITSDGIASGFVSSTNFLNATYTATTPTTSIDMWDKVIITDTTETSGVYCAIDGNLRLQRSSATAIGIRGFLGNLACDVSGLTLALNDEVIIHANVTGTGATVDVWVNGEKSSHSVESTNTIGIAYSNLVVGGQFSNGNYSPSNSVDLKYQKVLFDGIPVFNGCKTGIDTIKPDGYTAVGTPTITSDGIASGLDSNNYVKLTNSITLGTDFELYIPFTYPADASTVTSPNNCIMRAQSGSSFRMLCNAYANGSVNFNMSDGTNSLGTPKVIPNYVMNANESAIIVIKQKNQTCTYGYIKNGVYTQTGTKEDFPLDMPEIDVFWFGRGSGTSAWVGSIDLNAIKFYKYGDLVYQPCLKIPYAKTADDKKFIAPVYEDRAKDMAEQFGVAPYHILDETNGNFAFPYGSVEEKVAPKIVVGHYESGASAWEQYLDRTMIQRGIMVADTDVTFPCSDDYANTDFALSCPFSAKITSGFTPSASGTYIAVGKF